MGRPIIGITMGDPAGVGPEVIIKALSEREIYDECRPLVIGDARVLRIQNMDPDIRIRSIKGVEEGGFTFREIEVIDLENIHLESLKIGEMSKEGGRASVEYIKEATRLALDGRIDGIVTAPISKEAINKAGFRYHGHTDLLADLTGVKEYAMFFVSPSIRVGLVTVHLPLKDVPQRLNSYDILKVIKLVHHALIASFEVERPRIGVAALNPHAGEGGIFGREEGVIKAAIDEAQGLGIDAEGPYPADTLFVRRNLTRYDAFIAMYHDQGLIPVKLLDFERAVNVTLGLPFPRTSVDHGTGFDIATKALANPSSMKEAIRLAIRLVRE